MKITARDITFTALMAACLCLISPLSIPLPGGVPITLSLFVIFITGIILGAKRGTAALCIYLLLGIIGLPVFSGFSGGLEKVLGPTGGYMIGYIFLVLCTGLASDKSNSVIVMFLGMLLGLVICYIFGTVWLAFVMHTDIKGALMAGVVPFILGDMIKLVLGLILGIRIKKAVNANSNA